MNQSITQFYDSGAKVIHFKGKKVKEEIHLGDKILEVAESKEVKKGMDWAAVILMVLILGVLAVNIFKAMGV